MPPKAKGDCYQAAVETLEELHRAGIVDAELCHGWPTLVVPPFVEFGHAWVEVGCIVFDVSNGCDFFGSRERYYAAGKIDPWRVVRYSHDAMRRMLIAHEHYGPWGQGAHNVMLRDALRIIEAGKEIAFPSGRTHPPSKKGTS